MGRRDPRPVPDRLLYHPPVPSPEEERADDDGGADAQEEDEGREEGVDCEEGFVSWLG